MRKHLDQALKDLKEKLLTLASLAGEMIGESIRALVERDSALIQLVFEREEEADRLCIEIDHFCQNLLSQGQPTGVDLRFVTSAIKINANIERIADQALNIAQRGIVLIKEPPVKPLIDIPRMANLVQQMLRESLDAFVWEDGSLARKVLKDDDEVDNLRDQVYRELLTYMMADPTLIPRALQLILVSRHLERAADHATNIAEDVIYILEGKDVRHQESLASRKGRDAAFQPRTFEKGRLWVNFSTYEVKVEGKPVVLTPTEFKLLRFLIDNLGRVFTRDELLDLFWGQDVAVEPRTVDVHIKRLRAKIEKDPTNPQFLLTHRGIGYKFAE